MAHLQEEQTLEWYSEERTMPERTVALASLSCHCPTVDGPNEAQIGNDSCIDPPKAKGTAIKLMTQHVITIPAPTP